MYEIWIWICIDTYVQTYTHTQTDRDTDRRAARCFCQHHLLQRYTNVVLKLYVFGDLFLKYFVMDEQIFIAIVNYLAYFPGFIGKIFSFVPLTLGKS